MIEKEKMMIRLSCLEVSETFKLIRNGLTEIASVARGSIDEEAEEAAECLSIHNELVRETTGVDPHYEDC